MITYQSFALDKKMKQPEWVASFLVETIGIEPMTSCMSSKRSNHLGYASATMYIIPYKNANCKPFFAFFENIFRFFKKLFTPLAIQK